MKRVIIYMVISSLFITISCQSNRRISQKSDSTNRYIEYYCFPELEQRICDVMKNKFLNQWDSVYIAIELAPYQKDIKGRSYSECKLERIKLVLCKFSSQLSEIDFKYLILNSNRVFFVCNKKIPIEFIGLDYSFARRNKIGLSPGNFQRIIFDNDESEIIGFVDLSTNTLYDW